MSSKINLQTCEYARKSSIFQDNQLILYTYYKHLFDEYGVEKETYKDWVAKRRAYLGRGYIRDEF